MPPAVEVQSLNHWTTRDGPVYTLTLAFEVKNVTSESSSLFSTFYMQIRNPISENSTELPQYLLE